MHTRPPEGRFITCRARSTAQLQPAEPIWTWLATSDTRVAWTGTWPESKQPLRVEAASLRGKPVGFLLIAPWTVPWRTPPPSTGRETLFVVAIIGLLVALLVAAALLALEKTCAKTVAIAAVHCTWRRDDRTAPGAVGESGPRCRVARPVRNDVRRNYNGCLLRSAGVDVLSGTRAVRASLLASNTGVVDEPFGPTAPATPSWDGMCSLASGMESMAILMKGVELWQGATAMSCPGLDRCSAWESSYA